ncbi:hypothetical protein [Streptomyces sp. NPDC051577]|uniref:hypothetical protein n=1 Tax=Streptomyces sp. NPDC051577 TaxID=3155166 RepID=UPI00343BB3A7
MTPRDHAEATPLRQHLPGARAGARAGVVDTATLPWEIRHVTPQQHKRLGAYAKTLTSWG